MEWIERIGDVILAVAYLRVGKDDSLGCGINFTQNFGKLQRTSLVLLRIA